MARKRVLHLADSPYFGGITSHILSVAEAFRDDPDWEIVLATLPGKRTKLTRWGRVKLRAASAVAPFSERARDRESMLEAFDVEDSTLIERGRQRALNVHTIPMGSTFDVRVLRRLRAFVREHQIDLVHTHAYRANVIAAKAHLTVPVITTSHGLAVNPGIRLRLWQALHLREMRQLPFVIACSNFVSDTLAISGVSNDSLRVVHNGCPPPNEPEKRLHRGAYDFPEDKLIALYVGRLAPGKEVDRFLDALSKRNDFYGVIAGDGPLFKDLVNRAAANGVSCSFVGAVPDPSPYYHLADVVVLPTQMEALPMTLIEAASYGKPVIATNVGGVPEVVVQGETGVLVDDNRVESWINALEQLTDASLRNTLGEAARIRHREHFSLEALRNGLSAVYSDVLLKTT